MYLHNLIMIIIIQCYQINYLLIFICSSSQWVKINYQRKHLDCLTQGNNVGLLGPWSTFFSPANGNCAVQLVSVVHRVNEKCMLIHSRHLAQRSCHFPDRTAHLGPDKTEPFVVFSFFLFCGIYSKYCISDPVT